MAAAAPAWQRSLTLCVFGASALLTFWLWEPLLELELLGWDNYPLIAASRVAHLSDLAGVLGDELMGGRYPLGHYWRPLVQLSFAFDYARGGLDARVYHVTDLLLLCACALALIWCSFELIGRQRRVAAAIGACAAGLLLLVQPVWLDVLPAPARRAETLALLFTLLALGALRAGSRGMAALCVALALLSKESGAIALLALIALAAWTANAQDGAQRARATWHACWPACIAAAVVLLLRVLVLGGIGGGRESSLAAALSQFPDLLADGFRAVVAPRIGSQWLALGLGSACAAWVYADAIRREATTAEARPARLSLTLAFLATWVVAIAAVTSLAGVERRWYELPFTGVRCVFVALLVATAWEAWRSGQARLRAVALVGLAGALAAGDWRAFRTSPGLSELQHASRVQREFLTRLERELEASPPGSRIEVAGLPIELEASRDTEGNARTLPLLAPYSVAAWLELALPGRKLRVEQPGERAIAPRDDEVVVVLSR